MDVDARLEAVEAENDLLRERVMALEALLGMHAPAPLSFRFTGSEGKVFGVLMKRDLVTKEAVMAALYGARPDETVEIKIVDVFICKMRKKLKPHDIPIETVWGVGYRLAPEAKSKARDLMVQEGLAA